MKKITTVMFTEYLRAVRTKAFLLSVLVMPLLFGGGIIAVAVAEQARDTQDRNFVVVDETGVLLSVIRTALDERNEQFIFEDGEQVDPRWVLEAYDPEASDERMDVALSDRIEEGELLGFLVIGADIVDPGGEDRRFSWYTDTPTYDDLSDWLGRIVNTELRRLRFAAAGVDGGLVDRLSGPVYVNTLGLASVNEQGEVSEAEESNMAATVAIPVGLAMLMFMLVMMSTPALMNNVLEEKMQKIAEVLVSSVSPFGLLLGKLLSAVLVSLTLAILYVGAILLFVHNVDQVPTQIVDAISPGILAWFLFFMLMALLIYGSIFSGLGAACSEIQDAQTLMMPAMLVLIVPMMFLGPIIKSPDGMLATVLSYFPPATPIVMFLRIAMPPGAEWWEIALSSLLMVLFTLGCVLASSKIFRIGILAQGQTPSYRKLLGWLVSK